MTHIDQPSIEQTTMHITRRQAVTLGTAAVAMLAASGPASAQGPNAALVLAGDTALVTGGARGIGRAIAVALAQAGADVAVLDIAHDIDGHPVPLGTPGDLAETIRLVEGQGRRATALQADIRDLQQIQAAVAQAEAALGPVTILAANAGVNSNVKFAGTELESYRRHWDIVTDVNVKGTANTLRALMPAMMERGRGRIVLTSSTFGRQGNDANPAYVASKWAITGLTKAAAIEAGPSGVTVNAIAPTAVRTGLGGPQTPESRARADEWLMANYHKLPVGLLEPEDVAGTVVFLASPAARYITGEIIDVAAGANTRYTA